MDRPDRQAWPIRSTWPRHMASTVQSSAEGFHSRAACAGSVAQARTALMSSPALQDATVSQCSQQTPPCPRAAGLWPPTPGWRHPAPGSSGRDLPDCHPRRSTRRQSFAVSTAGQSGRGQGEVLGQYPGRGVGVPGQCGLLQPAVLANVVPVGNAVRRPAASQLARGPRQVEGLQQDGVATALQQGAVEDPVGFGPCAAVVLALLQPVRRGAGQTACPRAPSSCPTTPAPPASSARPHRPGTARTAKSSWCTP